MPDPVRNVRVPSHVWQPALATARERGEPLSDVIRAALETYVAEHNRHRLVRLTVGNDVVGVDPVTLRTLSPARETERWAAVGYTWSEVRNTFAKRPRDLVLTSEQAAEVRA